MTPVIDVINHALAKAGPAVVARLNSAVDAFDALRLAGRERLGALAIAIAAIASRHHRRHPTLYIEAAKCWALELTVDRHSASQRVSARYSQGEPIRKAARRLAMAFNALFKAVRTAPISREHRVAIELAPIVRLLARYDADSVVATLESASRCLAEGSPRAFVRDAVAAPVFNENSTN
jgi:hypothetical protein